MATVTIDLRSPEKAWEPFMVWCRDQGIEPRDTRAITFDPETMTADVTVMKRNADGKFYVEAGDLATEIRSVTLTVLPPRRS